MDNVKKVYPLTAAQKGLLYQTLLTNSDALYRTQSRDNVFGAFDSALFRAAIDFLVCRHENLRCLFLHEGLDEPAAVVRERVELPWHYHDFSGLNPEEQHQRLDRLAQESMERPLVLNQAPLFRVTVAKLSNEQSQVIFDIHHLIFDGWSSVLFFTELQIVYAALRDGYEPVLPEAGKFSDYAVQLHAAQSADDESRRVQSHWMEKLSGFDQPTALQIDTPVIPVPEEGLYTNARYFASLDRKVTHSLNELARTARVTMSTIVEAAWALTLARYNDTDDVVVGVTLNGRSSALQNHERTFGMFVNALPLRLPCAAHMQLYQWLDRAQKEKAILTQNENASLADIHIASELPAGVDIFDVLLVFQTFPDLGSGTGTPPIGFSNYSVHENSPLPAIIDVFHGEQLNFMVMYTKERLSEAAIGQLMGHYLQLLTAMAELKHPEKASLAELSMLNQFEENRLLKTFSSAIEPAEDTDTLQQLFVKQAEKTPDLLAVRDDATSLSYRELNEKARTVALFLRANDVHTGDPVAVALERSVDLYPAMLGVLMAGALFVPVDPGYPAIRQNHMLNDSGTRWILSHSASPKVFDAENRLVVDLDTQWQDIQSAAEKTRLTLDSIKYPPGAYIMYTSGSTGLAKGVVGSQEATLNRFKWMWESYPFKTGEVCCQKTSISFVDSIWELFGPLLKGVPVLIINDDFVKNVYKFVDFLETENISRVLLLPSYLSVMLDSVDNLGQHLARLSLCSVSGEPLVTTVAQQFSQKMPHCLLLNLYGSTEVSGDVTAFEIPPGPQPDTVYIGKPIRNNQVYILDANLNLMPEGTIGELCVAGRGLSLGYWGESESLNLDKFPDNPFGDGKLYRTGDRARLLPSGSLEHHGRKDAMLKIRGYRIEPAEIERVIAGFDGVRAALVNAPGNNKLHAYYRVRQGASVNAGDLKAHVDASLPDYMVPQVLMEIDTFPRLPNGKISRKDLPDPTITQARRRVKPRTESERKVAEIWEKVLGTDDISVYDNFVSSGGSSLAGMRFNARLQREFGKAILPRMLLNANLAQIAAYLRPDDAHDGSDVNLDIDLMEPLYFGEPGARLYGVLHIPGAAVEAKAVLLCPSIGHEYMRLHRGYQILATALAREGYHVLRFDFYGIGDSEGESSEATLEQWYKDVRQAAQLLIERSGAAALSVVGVRMGAPVLAGAGLEQVEKTILWDPVCSGAYYLNHLDALHHYAMKNLDRFRFKQYKSNPWERFGYTWSEQLSKDILSINYSLIDAQLPNNNIHVVTTGGVTYYGDMGVNDLLGRAGVKHDEVNDISLWFNYDQASYLAFVQPVLTQISTIIKG